MTANLDGVRIKLRRAQHLTEELRALLSPLADRATNSIVGAPADEDPSTLEYLVIDVPEIDPMASAIAGDIVHNLRGALDHLAWQLVLLDGGQPDNRTAFPLHDSRHNDKGIQRVLTISPGVNDPRIMAAVEQMQPYKSAEHGQEPATDALGIIQRLDNIDKHRLLLTVVHRIDYNMPAWWGSSEGDPSPKYWFNPARLAAGDVVAKFGFDGSTPPAGFDPHLNLAVTIDEPEASWGLGLDIVETMKRLQHGVAQEINQNIIPLMPGEQWFDLS